MFFNERLAEKKSSREKRTSMPGIQRFDNEEVGYVHRDQDLRVSEMAYLLCCAAC